MTFKSARHWFFHGIIPPHRFRPCPTWLRPSETRCPSLDWHRQSYPWNQVLLLRRHPPPAIWASQYFACSPSAVGPYKWYLLSLDLFAVEHTSSRSLANIRLSASNLFFKTDTSPSRFVFASSCVVLTDSDSTLIASNTSSQALWIDSMKMKPESEVRWTPSLSNCRKLWHMQLTQLTLKLFRLDIPSRISFSNAACWPLYKFTTGLMSGMTMQSFDFGSLIDVVSIRAMAFLMGSRCYVRLAFLWQFKTDWLRLLEGLVFEEKKFIT